MYIQKGLGNSVSCMKLKTAAHLICPDERLHCQVVLHEFVDVRLCLHQGLCMGHGSQGASTQGKRTLVGSARRGSSIGVSEKNVP